MWYMLIRPKDDKYMIILMQLFTLNNADPHTTFYSSIVKPVCNDHLYDKMYYLWLI